MLPNMFLAYIRLIFRASFVEIATAILLVYNILKMPLDVIDICNSHSAFTIDLLEALYRLETCWAAFNKNCVK
jgi:hypothetical protein